MPEIVLAGLNAKYIHPAFGLRCLMANLGPLRERACLEEFDLGQRPVDMAEVLLARQPAIVGVGVYIWNVTLCTELVAVLKCLRPEVRIILGGPEISHETEAQPIARLADHVITGEADLKFAEVCQRLLRGEAPPEKVIPAPRPDLSRVALPYSFYADRDLAHRITYVETSRGCPFGCEFCLSSLDEPVRRFPLKDVLEQLDRLLQRGARHLKFVDRTFNVDAAAARAVLEFLRERHQPGMLFHFEVVPDRLPQDLLDLARQFPPGALQFEAGVQTFNPEVAGRIGRSQSYPRLEHNLRFLREHTGVHVHSDLIVGLPGESLASLAAGFDRLAALGVQEIQVGLLKRLRGAPISRHDAAWQMLYSPQPPYEILSTSLIDFPTMQRLRRFARYWDLFGNTGNFLETTPLIWTRPQADAPAAPSGVGPDAGATAPAPPRPFDSFLRFSDWLFAQVRRTDSLSLVRQMELLARYLIEQVLHDPKYVALCLCKDGQRTGHRERPPFLCPHWPDPAANTQAPRSRAGRRQAAHRPAAGSHGSPGQAAPADRAPGPDIP